MEGLKLDQDGLNGLDEIQNQKDSDEISISPGALDKSDKAHDQYRGRGQTARNWAEISDVKPDENGFIEDGEGQKVLEDTTNFDGTGIETELDRTDDYVLNTGTMGLEANATLSGVQSAAMEIFERDIVTVETPQMDRTGVSGSITVNIDQDKMNDYLEDVSNEFGEEDFNQYASAAIGVALNTITDAVTEGYEGDISISYSTPTEQVPENFNKRVIDEDHWREDGDYEVRGASFVEEIAEEAISTYEQNLAEYEEQHEGQEYEEDAETALEESDEKTEGGGLFGGDGIF